MPSLSSYVPALHWLSAYDRSQFVADLIASIIVTVLLIPQSLAYAMIAGLPSELGLYASIWPLVLYALFGSSRTLSVGPVAVISLLTASSVGAVNSNGLADPITAAVTLSLLSGIILLAMGSLKMGFMASFLSHGVITGFVLASALLIAIGQLKHILSIHMHGESLLQLAPDLWRGLPDSHIPSLILGGCVIAFLFSVRSAGAQLLIKLGARSVYAQLIAKLAPMIAVIATMVFAFIWEFENIGVVLVGEIPQGLPALIFKLPSFALISELLLPAFMIAMIGFVESISVGQTLAAKHRQSIDANQELVGLGAANIASGLSGAFPVTGGFSRSVVNFDAGAVTQAASIFTAIGIAMVSLFLTPYLYYLPKATLAATIIIAVLSLVDLTVFRKTWRFSRMDFWAIIVTVAVTLLAGVEYGVIAGVAASFVLFVYRASNPHMAEVGRIKGTEHFRNRLRFDVETAPNVYMLRIDASLFFANTNYLEKTLYTVLRERPELTDIVLVGAAINSIDFSALEGLEKINLNLQAQNIRLHFCEIKGPVMDRLKQTDFLNHLSGKVFMSQQEAFNQLARGS